MTVDEQARASRGVTSRQPVCPECHPHEWHLLPCDGCLCEHSVAPGIYT